jgi:NifB/MoaA-like Fe-S oxidoreductase
VVLSPGVNDGQVLRDTLRELYEFGPAILGCSVVPVGLTEFSKHHLVREPTTAECRAAIALVEERAAVALAQRGAHWAFGADELYLRAEVELPPAAIYDGFDQVENGVGAVRWLQQRIEAHAGAITGWEGRRVGVVTGMAMSRLMPLVLEPLARVTGARFELLPVSNTLFGASVTTAGLLPGTAVQEALRGRGDLDLALLPGECVNDDGLFVDGMSAELLGVASPMEIRFSKDFADALEAGAAA